MQVNAEIHLGTRSVIEYLLSPVQTVVHEAWAGALIVAKVTLDPSYFHSYLRINAQVKVNRRHPQSPRRG
jgi:hypothetical protein